MLADDSRSTLGIMRKWKVDVLCTSDDLLSDVGVHRKATEKTGTIRVLPSLRGDSILAFGTDANRRLVAGLSETVSADGLDSYLAGISADGNIAPDDKVTCLHICSISSRGNMPAGAG